jgi:hypothetical protein
LKTIALTEERALAIIRQVELDFALRRTGKENKKTQGQKAVNKRKAHK